MQHDPRSSPLLEANNNCAEDDGKPLQYFPFQIPPDLNLAKLHRKAQKVGIVDHNSTHYCPCCNQATDKRLVAICAPEKKLSFLGVGFPLYFRLIKYFCVLILVIFIFGGSFLHLILDFQCGKRCIDFLGFRVLDLDRINSVMKSQTYTNAFVVIAIIIAIAYIKPLIFHDIEQLQEGFLSAADYTIMVQNLPQSATKAEILQFFEDLTSEKIVKANMAYDITEYQRTFNRKVKLMKELQEVKNQVRKPRNYKQY